MEITPDQSRDEIAKEIGASVRREDLRNSDARARRLEAGSQRRTRSWDLSLQIDENHPTAQVDQSPDTGPEIIVSGKEQPQPVTDYEGEEWDWLVQRAFACHEDGHVRYTDHDDKMERLNDLATGDRGTAHDLWNVIEDGAIERQLHGRWPNYYEIHRTVRANLFSEHPGGIPDVELGGYVFPLAHATSTVLMDIWVQQVYDLNLEVRDKLFDPNEIECHFSCEDDRRIFMDKIRPLCEQVIADALSEPNAVDRNAIIFEFIEEVLSLISKGRSDGKSQKNRADDRSTGGMPDDSRDNHSGEAQDDADYLGDDDIEIVDVEYDPDADTAGESIDDVEVSGEVIARIVDEVGDEQIEVAGVNDDLLDELEEMQEAIKGAGSDLKSQSILLPMEDRRAVESRAQSAKAASKPIAQILRNRLQQERVSTTIRNQRRGALDSPSLHRTAVGERRIKRRKIEPEDKDYHFLFVLDRSSSMGWSDDMKRAEEALGMLAYALEEVGVEVSIIELYTSKARLAKPFGVPIDSRKEHVFNGETAGGTPIGAALQLARERLLREGDNRYMVVITDDEPGDSALFEETVSKSPMPVIGINIGVDASDVDYHRQIGVTDASALKDELVSLVQEVMF